MRSPGTKLAPNHLGFVVQVIVATLNNSLSMPGSIMPVPGPQRVLNALSWARVEQPFAIASHRPESGLRPEAGPPQHGLSSKATAPITSDRGATRSLRTKWP